MRKQFKKVLSMVLSAAMVLTLGSGLELKTADAADTLTVDGEYSAHLVSGIDSWKATTMGAINFDGADTKTVELEYKGSFAGKGDDPEDTLVLCADFTDLSKAAVASGNAIELTNISMQLDGTDFAVDKSKVKTGDIEDNGKYRIEIYNDYGSTKNDSPINVSAFKFNTSMKVTVTLKVVKAPDPTPTPVVTPRPTRNPDVTAAPRPTEVTSGTPDEILKSAGIHAYLFYQTSVWDCRNAYETVKFNKEFGPNYIKAGGVGSYDADKFQAVDVKLDHDGEYTVSLGGIDLSSADNFTLLGVSTDLDATTYPGVTASLSALQIDGKDVAAPEDPTLPSKPDADFYTFTLANSYVQTDAATDTWKNENETCPYFVSQVNLPEKSISITFKIAGLEDALMDIDGGAYTQPDNGTAEKPGPAVPTPTPNGGGDKASPTPDNGGAKPTPTAPTNPNQSAKPSATPAGNGGTTDAVVGAKVGASVTVGAFKLKVTKAATAKSAGTATVTGLSKSGKKAKSLNVKASMKKGAASYKVNKLGKNAFKGAKATKITLNKSINSIPAGAFANCKALKTLTLNAKLKKVTKKAFKGCKKNIAVKGKGKKANVKLLKKSGYKKFK